MDSEETHGGPTAGQGMRPSNGQLLQRPTPKVRRGQAGQSLVELAVLLPIWLVLVLGMLDLGRAFASYMAILGAAREGARYAAMYPADTTGILAHARREVLPSGINISAVEVTCPSGSCASNNPIRVTVRLDFALINSIIVNNLVIPLQASVDFVVL